MAKESVKSWLFQIRHVPHMTHGSFTPVSTYLSGRTSLESSEDVAVDQRIASVEQQRVLHLHPVTTYSVCHVLGA